MKFIADLHIHSHYSRATSRSLDPEHLAIWARKKGITLIGTGDFTHPGWVSELQEKLIEAENGLFRLRPDLEKKVEETIPESCRGTTRCLLSGEISCIYKKDGKTRKVHNLVLMPDFQALGKLNERLDRIGNITSDGRPILGLDSRDLLEIVLEASEKAFSSRPISGHPGSPSLARNPVLMPWKSASEISPHIYTPLKRASHQTPP